MATISIISMALITIIMGTGGAFIYSSFIKSKDRVYLYFSLSFFGFSIMHFFLTLGAYFSGINSEIAGMMYQISHVILFLAIALFLRVPLKIILPKMEKKIFIFVLILAIPASFLLFSELPLPVATDQGLTAWNIPDQIAAVVGTFASLMLLSAVFLFALSAKKSKDLVLKKRGIIMAVGVLILFTAGPAHNVAQSFKAKLLADVLTPVGAIIMLYGIYYPRLKEKKEINNSEGIQ